MDASAHWLQPRAALDLLQGCAVLLYVAAQALLVLYSSHRYLVLWRCKGAPGSPEDAVHPEGKALPRVTVQLPIYNEREVVERLIDAVVALDYPQDRLDIQVLDDSTDDTRWLAAASTARHRARGVRIEYLHRTHRQGFKAGALADGLRQAQGELVAIFDADFVPPPDFLRRLVGRFADPSVGMVQARWGHLNRRRNAWTSAQAIQLDAHFRLEHVSRAAHGLFFNFNGTAGIWRRACIEDAQGWSADTLTEDLDLSYRAQLRGWRFEFAPEVEAPAELPSDMQALLSQQRRWVMGSIQTARKILPRLMRAKLPWAVRTEAFFHLTANASYPLLLVLALLLLPVLLGPSATPAWLVWTLQAGVLGLGIVPVAIFLAAGQREESSGRRRAVADVITTVLLGVGLSLHNARAVFAGLGRGTGTWERTPKTGEVKGRGRFSYQVEKRATGVGELGLAAYFVAVGLVAATRAEWASLPFLALLTAGFGLVGGSMWRSGQTPWPGAGRSGHPAIRRGPIRS